MTATPVTRCGLCDSASLETVLSLGTSPPTCVMQPIGSTAQEERYPLELLRCSDCTLVQLSVIVDPDVVFAPDYPYSSGNSGQLRQHFAELARSLQGNPGDLVIDLGANDGTFLRACAEEGYKTVGVEPTGQAAKISGPCAQQPFTAKAARSIVDIWGQARYVTACNVLAHVPDPHDFAEGVRILLADDGRFVTENHHLGSVVAGQWDTVYHEHLRYYSPGTLANLLERHGLYVYQESMVDTHGGSFRSWASKTPMCDALGVTGSNDFDFAALRETAKRAKWYLRSYISAAGGGGDRVAALGATARATTVINYCELTDADLMAVYEVAGSDKLGHYVPGSKIPVVDERALFEPDAPEHLVLMSWHLADRIVPKLREGGYDGAIVLPLGRGAPREVTHSR
jgi:hypothetical protein